MIGLAEQSTSAAEPALRQTIGKAFLAAFLLTTSEQSAEAAVLSAIAAWDPAGENECGLLRRALLAALNHTRS